MSRAHAPLSASLPAPVSAPSAVPGWQRFDLSLCERVHDGCRREVLALFRVVSRLGNGPAWYALALGLLGLYGEAAAVPVLRMLVTGMLGSALYWLIKSRAARPRPFMVSASLNAEEPPLDEFSFPSGHTLHACLYAVLAGAVFPWTLWILVPFAVLTAASRIALGLHYPTDVAAGAALGCTLAWLALALV
ncbi:MAG: phosphatase PAP2 family protein [Acidobacteriota bacterium]|nr:phosphatase PAP2 family protein [Acidobacteriota bacterium]